MTLVSVVLSREGLPVGEWSGKRLPGTVLIRSHTFPSRGTVWVLGSMKALTETDEPHVATAAMTSGGWRSVAGSPVEESRLTAAESANMEIPRILLPCLDHAQGTMALWDVGRRAPSAEGSVRQTPLTMVDKPGGRRSSA